MMNRITTAAAMLAAGALLLTACGTSPNARPVEDSSGAPEELVFAVVPTDNTEDLKNSFKPIVAVIEDATGIPTSIETVTSNAGVIEAQVAERVDIAVYGAFSYYLAEGVADVTPIAKDQRTPEAGSGAVKSFGVVAADSEISEITDVAGKDVCFTDPASTTGYLAPSAGLLEAGIDPETDINPIYAGSHDVAVTQMLAGDCDVAFVAGTFITDLLPARGVIEEGETKTIWKSDDIPGTPMVLGNWLSDEITQQITDAVIGTNAVEAAANGFCDGGQREAPESWGEKYAGEPACEWGGTGAFSFVPTKKAEYEVIRKICENTDADVCHNE